MSKSKPKTLSKKEEGQLKTLSEIAEGRSNLYKFFSGLYAKPPTKKLLETLTDLTFIDEMALLFGKRATAPLKDFAKMYEPGKHLKYVKQEFHDLLLVPIEQKYVTPYESVFITGLMLQQPHVLVKEAYAQAGVKFNATDKIAIEDHIGSELNFMKYLTNKESKSWAKLDLEQSTTILQFEVKFLEDHLTRWVEDFAKKLVASSHFAVFKAIGKMTARFIDLDYRQSAELLEKIQDS